MEIKEEEPEDDLLLADLRADDSDRVIDVAAHRPALATVANAVDEVG